MKCNSVLCMYPQFPEAFALNYTYDAMLALPHLVSPLPATTGGLSSAAATECSVPLRPSHVSVGSLYFSRPRVSEQGYALSDESSILSCQRHFKSNCTAPLRQLGQDCTNDKPDYPRCLSAMLMRQIHNPISQLRYCKAYCERTVMTTDV